MTLINREAAMALLTRADILAAEDRPTRDVDVPEWGGAVRLRAMTGKDRDDFEQAISDAKTMGRTLPENMRAIIASRYIVGEDGSQMFTLADVTDLGDKSSKALARVFDAVLEMNKIEPGAIEDAAKNSLGDPVEGSSSGSPLPSDAPLANSNGSLPAN